MPFLLVANMSYTLMNHTQEPAQQVTQKQETKKQQKNKVVQITGTYYPVFYQKKELIDPETNEVVTDPKTGKPKYEPVINPKTGQTIYKISRLGEKAYLMPLDSIIEITIKQGDRLHYYENTENWKPEEKHLAYDPELKELRKAIYIILNGKDFDPKKIKEGQIIYLIDHDKNKLIVLDEVTYRIIRGIPDFYKNPLEINEDQACLVLGENRLPVGRVRGRLLTVDEALEIINSPREKKEESTTSP